MTRWTVHAHSDRLFSGLEIDFVETMQATNMTTDNLSVNDELIVEWASGGGISGLVVEANENIAIIEVDSIRYSIRKSTNNDVPHPIQATVCVIPWFVV